MLNLEKNKGYHEWPYILDRSAYGRIEPIPIVWKEMNSRRFSDSELKTV